MSAVVKNEQGQLCLKNVEVGYPMLRERKDRTFKGQKVRGTDGQVIREYKCDVLLDKTDTETVNLLKKTLTEELVGSGVSAEKAKEAVDKKFKDGDKSTAEHNKGKFVLATSNRFGAPATYEGGKEIDHTEARFASGDLCNVFVSLYVNASYGSVTLNLLGVDRVEKGNYWSGETEVGLDLATFGIEQKAVETDEPQGAF